MLYMKRRHCISNIGRLQGADSIKKITIQQRKRKIWRRRLINFLEKFQIRVWRWYYPRKSSNMQILKHEYWKAKIPAFYRGLSRLYRNRFVLKAFACRSSGNAFVYLPLIMEATSAGVAILLRKRSFGLGAFRIVPSLLFEAQT